MAQSTTRDRPAKGRSSTCCPATSCPSRGPSSIAHLINASTHRRPAAVPSEGSSQSGATPGPSRRGQASHASWIADCTRSSSFRPPAANNLIPLSNHGLCDAETTAPATPSIWHSCATAGVGTTPREVTSRPPSTRPSASARARAGPDSRVSRPMTTQSAPRWAAAARPRALTAGSSRTEPARARMPSVPNRSTCPDAAGPEEGGCTARPVMSGSVGASRGPIPDPPRRRLALGVLRSLAGLVESVLLGLLLAIVARKQAGLLEGRTTLGL